MKRLVSLVLTASVLAIPATAIAMKDIQTVPEVCPTGSYAIGEENGTLICKAEPTGCPYGENIPLDSPKCVAPKVETTETNTNPQVTPITSSVVEPEEDFTVYAGK